MVSVREQRFEVESVGKLYRKSMEMFAHRLEDENGNEVRPEDLEINRPFYVIFASGTGLTRTSARRIA